MDPVKFEIKLDEEYLIEPQTIEYQEKIPEELIAIPALTYELVL